VVGPINKLIETVPFDVYCYSLDWHPADHLSFVDNVHHRKLHETSPVNACLLLLLLLLLLRVHPTLDG
jgi:exosome complex component RRP4